MGTHRIHILFTALLGAMVLAVVPACGGGGDDAADAGGADADLTPDAPGALTGLGEACNGNDNPTTCVAPTPICAYSGDPIKGECTLICGTTSEATTMPPAAGHPLCEAQYNGAAGSGTPFCGATFPPAAGMKDWGCIILCGTLSGNPLGDCQAPMTCVLQTGETFGTCEYP